MMTIFQSIISFHAYILSGGVAQWLVLSPHSKMDLGLIPGQDVSVWILHVLPVSVWVLSGYSGFLPQSKNMHSKLPIGVSVSVDGSLSLYASLGMNWLLSRGYSAFPQRCRDNSLGSLGDPCDENKMRSDDTATSGLMNI